MVNSLMTQREAYIIVPLELEGAKLPLCSAPSNSKETICMLNSSFLYQRVVVQVSFNIADYKVTNVCKSIASL